MRMLKVMGQLNSFHALNNDDSSLLFDLGARNTRIGWAGNDEPSVTIPTCVGLPRSVLQREGPAAWRTRPECVAVGVEAMGRGMETTWLCRRGIVHNMDALAAFLRFCIEELVRRRGRRSRHGAGSAQWLTHNAFRLCCCAAPPQLTERVGKRPMYVILQPCISCNMKASLSRMAFGA